MGKKDFKCDICGRTCTIDPYIHRGCLKAIGELVKCEVCGCLLNWKHLYKPAVVVGARTRYIISCSPDCSNKYHGNPRKYLKDLSSERNQSVKKVKE